MPEGEYFMKDNNDLDLDLLNDPASATEDAPPNQNTTSHDAIPTESAPVPEPAQLVQSQIIYPPATLLPEMGMNGLPMTLSQSLRMVMRMTPMLH